MAASTTEQCAVLGSNQDLWKILTGHSSLREPALVKEELCAKETIQKLKDGLHYYKPPTKKSADQLKKKVKGQYLDFVLLLSDHLSLDELQSDQLLRGYLSSVYRGPLAGLGRQLAEERRRAELLVEVCGYYHSERVYLLRCAAHLLGYWQDSEHLYQEVYRECLDRVDQSTLIDWVWKQYTEHAEGHMPTSPKGEHEGGRVWVEQSLREQCLLLETALLYYKDYHHPTSQLKHTIQTIQRLEFGSRQPSRLTPSTQSHITHLNHLSALLLVELVDLETVQFFLSDRAQLVSNHHLSGDSAESAMKKVDELLTGREWGDKECHAPFLLAWMLLRYTTADPEAPLSPHCQALGDTALECGVFCYLLTIVDSLPFTGTTPLASLAKALVHTLLSVTLGCFSESSLGDPQVLIAIATKTLTHPRLLLEFWDKGPEEGVGVLLATAMQTFPQETPYSFLTVLSSQPVTAHSVTRYLHTLHTLTLDLGPEWQVEYSEDSLTLTHGMEVFVEVARQMGVAPVRLPAGTKGVLVGQRSEVVCWTVECSALTVLAFLTRTLLNTPGVGVDSTPDPLVAIVTDIVKLVTQILSSDWTLCKHFEAITSQFFSILQKYSPLPQPPTLLLAACVRCLAVMAKNDSTNVWSMLSRTGFLPYISGPVSVPFRIPTAPGHFGLILNTWERTRGMYDVTMAMLDLLISVCEGGDAVEGEGVLACVVWVCEEVMATCQGWRHRTRSSKEQLAHKLLLLCHSVLGKCGSDRVRTYLTHFLLHTRGHCTLISALSLGVHAVNRLLSNQQGPPPVQVESLKLALSIISTLLRATPPQSDPTVLEQALTRQSLKLATPTEAHGTQLVHLVSLIASYIHHHGDPLVPIGATELLTRLALVSPMSVFACLGQLATPIRDTFVGRLESRVEETELKVAIVELVKVCVQTQPGMAELFLCVRHTEAEYSIEESSCLNAVLNVFKPLSKAPPPALMETAASLLVSLWEGRHDAALFALRKQNKFWKNLCAPLMSLEDKSTSLLVVARVMTIITMETYYTVKSQLDKELMEIVNKLGPKVESWIKLLQSDKQGVLELTESISSLLLVLCFSPDTKHLFKDQSLRGSILTALLTALEAQLTTPTLNVPIVNELSMLYLVLLRKWSMDVSIRHCNKALRVVSRVLLSMPSSLATPLYSIALLALQIARNNNEGLETPYSVALIPCIADTLQNNWSQGSKIRADVMAVHVLKEIVHSLQPDNWLHPLQHHTVVTMVVRRVDHLLSHLSDCELVEAILVLFLGLAQHREGAESLLVNGVNHTFCISLTQLVSVPDPKEWREVWLLVLRLNTQLLHCLGHQFLSSALDFVGVHQERLAMALSLVQAVKDLPSLQETVVVCQFFLSLSHFRARWQFILPTLVTSLLEHLVVLATGAVAILNKRALLKHIIKTMHAAGLLPPDVGPVTMTTRRRSIGRFVSLDQTQLDDSLITTCPAFTQLQDGLVSIVTSSLYSLRHFSPPLDAMILDGVLDLAEYPSLFTLSLTPPILDSATPPSLGTLTTCLTTVLSLLNKVDPGSPTKSLSLSRSQSTIEKRAGLVCLLEQAVFLLLSQATRCLVDPTVEDHDKQLLKKELGSELGTFLKSLLLNFSRKGAPSPASRVATPSRSHSHLTDSGSSGKHSSLVFSEDQGMFRLADSFIKQFLR